MLHRLVACAMALAVLAPVSAAVSTEATAAVVTAASAKPTPDPVRRDVRLGHRPVRYDGNRPSVRLTFHARKGRLVELADWSAWPDNPCVRTSLRRQGGRAVDAWATGYWRLPRTGTYTAVLRPCAELDDEMRVQVRRVVIQDASPDGPATAVGGDPDVTHLVRLRLSEGERLALDPSRTPRHLVLPDGSIDEDLSYGRLALDAGARRSGGTGSYYAAMRPDDTVAVSRAIAHDGALDGAAVGLANQGVGGREHVVSFEGQAGQWVYPELLDSAGVIIVDARARLGVLAPSGAPVRTYVMTSCPGGTTSLPCQYLNPGPWQLPETGTYRMSVAVIGSAAGDTFTLRVRAAAVAPALTLDGPAVTYAATTPGQWVIGPYTEHLSGSGPMVTASNASAALTDWRMSLASGFPNSCGPRDTSNGCPDYWHVTLTPDSPRRLAPMDGNAGPSMALLAVPPGVMGSLDVRLTSQ